MEAKQRKAREQHERDNPKMCKPTEPIPMPYKNNPDDNKIEMYHGYWLVLITRLYLQN